MFAPDFHRNSLPRLITFLMIVAFGGLWVLIQSPSVSSQGSSFKNFESPQVHPLAITPDGTRLLAVNSPNATLSVFQLVSGSPVLTAEIPVGFEPVSVAARNNREAWVVNWMSDSVSIVDLTTGNVVRTIDVGDEPTDVIFAGPGNSKAFVCVSGGSQDFTGSIQVTGASGAVKVFDANNPSVVPQTTIQNFGKQPRALARNADGSRVFVSIFESGNQTTIVPEPIVAANGGLPPPNPPVSLGLPVPPNTSLIVKWDGSNWRDEINRSWNAHIPFSLSDTDVLVLDASNPANVIKVRGIGTHIGNMAFNASADQLIVANLEDINQVRFEPNLSGRFQASRVSILNTASPTPTLVNTSDLNSHVDFGNPGGTDAERALSLALPADVARHSDGTVYVAATSSAKVGVLTSAGGVTGRIVVGKGPTGLALDEPRQRLYVLNRFDQTLSVVDTGTKAELSQVSIGFNPEPASVRDGRIFLYDARNLSSHGTVSCASCHLNAHRDGMVWDLGNPQGSTDPVTTSLPTGFVGSDNLHPMKGPMMTQSLRGIIGNEPFHWRGDRAGLENFNGAFVSLLGGRLLSNEEMASFKAFVASLTYPPNPNEFPSRFPSQNGFFQFNKLFGPPTNPSSGTINCDQCHLLPNFATGSDKKITPKADLVESQSVKVPHFRGLYQKVGMRKIAGEQLTGFGFTHDGSFDTLFNFQKAPQFNFGQAGSVATADGWRVSIEDMILRFDTGTAPAVGMMFTVNATNKQEAPGRISLLEQQAQSGNCDLVVRGFYFGSPRGFRFVGNFMYQPDSLSEPLLHRDTLLNAVGEGNELTFMGIPPGQGALFALDRNGNGILNDDEPRTSVSITGRAVNASGVGIAGVTVTLSGTQSATAVTDSTGKFVFNLVSINGSHTVTPASGQFTFFPANRTFTNPTWNQSATFIAATGVNASDASVFFVTQHYNDFLNREPDQAGLNFWVGEIEGCGADAQCREIKRINVSAAFYLAIEHQETGFLVYRAHKLAFGNLPGGRPVPIVFADLMNDTQRVGHNVRVGIGDWQAQLNINQQAYFMGLVQRPEFLAQFPASMSPLDFVNKLDVNSGDAFTDAERDALVSQLNAGGNTTAARAAVVRAAAGDQTLFDAEFRKAFVLMQYYGYLRRNPDSAPDTDFRGWQFWLDKLNQFNGNFVNAEMVKAFITSIEYRNRFGQ
jgi:YVTN family beta-propeller protein